MCLCMRTPNTLPGVASSRDSNKRSSWDSCGSVLRSGQSSNYTGSVFRFLRSKDGNYMGASRAGISPPLMSGVMNRKASREADIPIPSNNQRSVSDSTVWNGPRRRLGRFWHSKPFRSNDEEEAVMVGFIKRSTGLFSIAWFSDTLVNNELKDPGRGWRPFKAVLMSDTLLFYKVPASMIPEIRRTFQIRSTQWPTTFHASDTISLSTVEPDDDDSESQSATIPDSCMSLTLDDREVYASWKSPNKHPELYLVNDDIFPSSWASRIDRGTPAALAHELVFGTQRPSGGLLRQEADTKTFLHIIFYSLNTTHVPWHIFLCALSEYLGVCTATSSDVQRVAQFVELLLWKRPLLHPGHDQHFFTAMESMITQLSQVESTPYAPMRQQLNEWWNQVQLGEVCAPTDWLNEPVREASSLRTDLASLSRCWNVAVFVRQDPSEIARQIHSFHVDRLTSFLRLPVTAYRLSSSVTETVLRSFRFDATRPHWLTHVIMRQLLVDEAPERQGDAMDVNRVAVLQHWIKVGSNLLHLGDLAGWVAVCAALCSRAVASLDILWRGLPAPNRDLVTMQWSPKLSSFGWIEGVHASVEPVWTMDGAGHVASTPGGIPYFGNAGILEASTAKSAANLRVEVHVASQEPEFHRVRALAVRLGTLFEHGMPIPMGPAPIYEYQALFQRLSTYEFVLQTGMTDYMGSAVIVDGRVLGSTHMQKLTDWPTTSVPDGDAFFMFPMVFPAIMPTRSVADTIMARRDLLMSTETDRAYASCGRCVARVATQADEVTMSDELILYPMHSCLVGAKTITTKTISSDEYARKSVRDISAQPEKRFSVEIRAATTTRLLDILVLGTDHLVVRAPVEPRSEPVAYQILGVELNMSIFRDACLLSYRCWISASDLLESLMQRWHAAESACRELAYFARTNVPNQFPSWKRSPNAQYAREPVDVNRLTTIRLRVLEALHRWLELYPCEWIADLVLFDTLYKFLNSILSECTAIPSESPVLVDAIRELLSMLPTLPKDAIAALGLDCFANVGLPQKDHVSRAFDWTLSATDLVIYLESMMALPYSLVSSHDLALTAFMFEQMHDCRQSWLEAASSDPDTCLSIYRLLRRLPAALQCGCAPTETKLWDILPRSVQELCKIHEVLRDWAEAQVTEPRIGLLRRIARIHKFIDAVLLSRASMAHTMRRATPDDAGVRAPLPVTFLECAVLEGLTSSRSQAYRAAWEHVASERGVNAWLDLLATAPCTLPPNLPPCTPDIGWTITIFAHWAIRAKVRNTKIPLIEFNRYMSATDLANDALKLQQRCIPTEPSLGIARLRLVWLRDFINKSSWPNTMVLEDAALETSFGYMPSATPVFFFSALEMEREQKRKNVKAMLLKAIDIPDVSVEEQKDLPTSSPEEFRHTSDPPTLDVFHNPDDSLLRAVPTTRPSSSFCCTGALLTVWPYHKHPFVLQMVIPNGQKCTLKLPNYDEFCRWLACLQALPHVRMSECFDAGTYAAHVAEYLGRASASCIFRVPLRELSIRTGGLPLPPAIERILEEIEARGLHEQGIYRISGTRNAIDELENQLDAKSIHQISFSRIDVHVLTSVVKQWLRELPEPLVPYASYDMLIETERITQHEDRVKAMRDLIRTFPKCHYLALQRVTHHLTLVAKFCKFNLMAAHNIGLVFGSTLLNPPAGAGSVARGLENLGRAAHVVKIAVLMHNEIFESGKRKQ